MWILVAWQCISLYVFVKAFKKCCVSSAMDRNDEELRNGSDDDGDVGSECMEDQGTDSENGEGDTDW
jgi:hypothetical protein